MEPPPIKVIYAQHYGRYMNAELTLTVEYGDPRSAEMIQEALGPDNEGYLESARDVGTLVFRIKATSAGTLRNTVDDLMACLKAAEETLSLGSSHPVPDLDGDALLE
jgi:tRNA threonylcarbamoyladenosine modification (KEOPS) complex  Pcc1 subunit